MMRSVSQLKGTFVLAQLGRCRCDANIESSLSDRHSIGSCGCYDEMCRDQGKRVCFGVREKVVVDVQVEMRRS
jgi:hypothetical protein